MTRAQEVAAFCTELSFAELPPKVVHRAKQAFLDWVGVAVAGTVEKPAAVFLDVISQMRTQGPATVVGIGAQFYPVQAALANGFVSHVAELDDNSAPGGALHTGATIIPAALAAGELENVSGARLLEAIVTGYEVGIRVGMSVNPSQYHDRGFHTTGMAGSFGAAAAAAKVLGLDSTQIAHALAIAGSQAAGLRVAFGTPCKPLTAGRAAQNGVLGALLAWHGLRGPLDIFENEYGFCQATADSFDLSKLTAGFGSRFELLNCLTKRFASCGAGHAAIDSVLSLAQQHQLTPSDVEAVRISTTPMVLWNVGRIQIPCDVSEAKFSLPYSIAVALHDPTMNPKHFLDLSTLLKNTRNPSYRRICEAVEVEIDEEMQGSAYDPETSTWTRVTIRTPTTNYEAELTHAKGRPQNPLSDTEYEEKFIQLAGLVMNSDTVSQLRSLLATVETLPSVRTVTQLLCWKSSRD